MQRSEGEDFHLKRMSWLIENAQFNYLLQGQNVKLRLLPQS